MVETIVMQEVLAIDSVARDLKNGLSLIEKAIDNIPGNKSLFYWFISELLEKCYDNPAIAVIAFTKYCGKNALYFILYFFEAAVLSGKIEINLFKDTDNTEPDFVDKRSEIPLVVSDTASNNNKLRFFFGDYIVTAQIKCKGYKKIKNYEEALNIG